MTAHLERWWELHAPDSLTKSARHMLLWLARRAGADGALKHPTGTTKLIDELHYSEASVKRARRELLAMKLIDVGTGDGRVRSTYRVALPRPYEESHDPQLELFSGANSGEAMSASRPPWGVAMTPQGGQDDPPYTRARADLDHDLDLPLTPSRREGDRSPTICARASERGGKCANCRACGTTNRQQSKAIAKAAAVEKLEAERAELARQRERQRRLDAARQRDGSIPHDVLERELASTPAGARIAAKRRQKRRSADLTKPPPN